MFEQNIWKKLCFKEMLPPPNFFSTKYTKNIIKNEITSIYLKNWQLICHKTKQKQKKQKLENVLFNLHTITQNDFVNTFQNR